MPPIGKRVVTNRGDVGVVEEHDADGLVKVRLMTPHNTPSALSSWCDPSDLADGENVLPQPMSARWYCEAAMFCQAVKRALSSATTQET